MQATERRERPIIFSGEMVRAMLDGRKTMTRRVMKPQPVLVDNGQTWDWPKIVRRIGGRDISAASWAVNLRAKDLHLEESCPYGKTGDLLWVRETWQAWDMGVGESQGDDDIHAGPIASARGKTVIDYRATSTSRGPWRPSIHMPRWASRIMLEVTDVQVARVQSIDQADAITEGMTNAYECKGSVYYRPERDAFRILWDSLNAKRGYSWDSNPWVWVVEFKQVEATA